MEYYYYYYYVACEKAEAQRGQVNCPRIYSKNMLEANPVIIIQFPRLSIYYCSIQGFQIPDLLYFEAGFLGTEESAGHSVQMNEA